MVTTEHTGVEQLLEKAGSMIGESQALTISGVSSRQRAADIWDAIRAFRKQAEAQKEETCRPLKQAWEDTKKPFDQFVEECKGHEAALQKKMGEWDREQERLAAVAQAKIQAKIDAENEKKIAKAEAKGQDVSEVVLKVAPVVQAPPKSMVTQAGMTQTRSVRKIYEPKDLKSLMRAFPNLFDLNMARFNAKAKTGDLDGREDVTVREEYVYTQRG